MVSFSIGEVNKAGNANCRDHHPDLSKISKGNRPSPMEVEEEDEEEDVDFNPFLKDLPSPEASSSLSSENECLDGHFISEGKNSDKQFTLVDEVQNFATADPSCSVEESLIQISGSHSEARQKPVSKDPKFTFITQPEIANSCNQIQDATAAESSCKGQDQKHTVDLDGEDAICTRTRARYSLASFTLDELETFLQETDDEDDLQNVDDEEEYKKFLAAVLLGGDGDDVHQQNPSAEDEDEDNDADFEIELEEALESEPDEITGDQTHKDVKWAGRRPETRQNKHQKGTVKSGQKLLVLEKRPLRPLLPILPNQPVASYANYGKTLTPWNAPRPGSVSSAEETNLVNGFTTQQIGQLYCLIHEHVQLLIQVFSLCILDFSRPHIASQVRELIFEMLHKRKEVLGWKNVSYPSICFCPPYSYSSVPYEIPRFITQSNPGSSPFFDANSGCSSQLPSQMAASHSTHPGKGKHENVPSGQGQVVEGYFWVPSVSRPVLTALDVAPLDLVEKYFEDIDTVIQEYRRRHVESSSASPLQFEPLFPFSSVPSFQGVNEMVLGNVSSVATSPIPSSPRQQPPKKTLAATLVESTKKQSVALVPTEVAKLAKNFFPLFNPALFPHKPPPGGVVNRVLFTDAEDELLALGMMEFNTDWKAIQQRFLPCKSKHQIFVRQKNQCSSKASENPIKAVRRMKTSHLTTEELSRIQEGLKVFKSDWMSVWRFVVPYRDPSLLSRQWRIALGTHRSYKQDPAGRERRRLYESNRRKRKAMNLTSWQHTFERENGNSETAPGTSNSMGKNMDNAGNTCVNEGILADCREGTYGENLCSNLKERHLPSNTSLRKPPCNEQQSGDIRSEEARPQTGNVNFYPLPEYLHPPSSLSTTARRAASTRAPIYCRPYRGRSRRTHSPCMVKLAPNLPPVNLPPSVRVVSQSVFRDSQLGAPSQTFVARGNVGAIGREISDPRISQVFNSGSSKSNGSDMQKPSGNSIPVKAGLTPKTTEGCRVNDNKGAEWGSPISDHHMHPLLFQAPDDGRLSYYPLDCSNSNSNSFSFFSGNQPQLNLSLFHNPPSELLADCFTQLLKSKGSTSTSSGIDFHPLLQRSDDLSAEPGAACPYTQLSVRSRGNCVGMTTRTKSKRPRGESADLDLEMHLSLTSNEDKVRGNGNVELDRVELDRAGSMMNSSDLRSMPDNLCSNNAYGQDELFPTSNDGRYNGDEIDEQFHPEIVMEQEELSDSDDEIEENVEFECEEMTDSDGEDGSGLEPIVPVQNKDSNLVPEENDTEADHEGDEHCYKANGDLLENDTTPCLELDLASQMKDDASRTSWLSLDSCASESALIVDPNQKEVIIGEGSYPSNRSYYKKKRTKSGVEAKRQLLLGPLAAGASRKPQKQAGKRNANSNDVSAGESTPGCDGKY